MLGEGQLRGGDLSRRSGEGICHQKESHKVLPIRD